MRLNLPYLVWGLRRLLAGRAPELREVATRRWTLCPEETATIPPAIRFDGALDRISGLSPWRNWDTERLLIEGGRITHAATEAYLVEGAALSGPALYRGAASSRPGYGAERLFTASSRPTLIEEAHFVTNWAGAHFFGNHYMDAYPLALLPPPRAVALSAPTNAYGHDAGYRRLLGLPPPIVISRARIAHLTLYDDFAQNRLKVERHEALRARLRAAVAPFEPPAGGVYLKRGATGAARLVTNEAELETRLRSLGFSIVEPATMSAEEIARRMLDAPIVVSVEGSHVSHALYTIAASGALLILQPPDRFAMAYKEPADALGLRFAFLVGDPAEGGFSVDPDDVERMIERLG